MKSKRSSVKGNKKSPRPPEKFLEDESLYSLRGTTPVHERIAPPISSGTAITLIPYLCNGRSRRTILGVPHSVRSSEALFRCAAAAPFPPSGALCKLPASAYSSLQRLCRIGLEAILTGFPEAVNPSPSGRPADRAGPGRRWRKPGATAPAE